MNFLNFAEKKINNVTNKIPLFVIFISFMELILTVINKEYLLNTFTKQ